MIAPGELLLFFCYAIGSRDRRSGGSTSGSLSSLLAALDSRLSHERNTISNDVVLSTMHASSRRRRGYSANRCRLYLQQTTAAMFQSGANSREISRSRLTCPRPSSWQEISRSRLTCPRPPSWQELSRSRARGTVRRRILFICRSRT